MNRGYRRFRKFKPAPGEGVNLGLSEIIEERKVPVPTEPDMVAALQASCDSAELKPVAPLNEYEILANSQRWSELGAMCDSRLCGPGGTDLEARLRWILSQLRSATVPPAILAAPLESATAVLMDDGHGEVVLEECRRPALIKLAVQLLRECGSAFLASDSGLSRDFLDRAVKLERSLPPSVVPPKKSVECMTTQKVEGQEPFVDAAQVREDSKPIAVAASPIDEGPSAAWGGRRRISFIAAGGLVVTALVCLTLREALSPSGSDISADTLRAALDRATNAVEPRAAELETLSEVSHLDAVLYDLKTHPASARSVVESLKAAVVGESNSDGPGAQAGSVRQLEVVNTSGPVEPPQVFQLANRRVPSSGEHSGEIFEGVEDGSSLERSNSSAGSPPVPGYKDFSRGRRYEIIASTKVLSEPSLRGEEIGQIGEGEKVLVEGKEGYWLRVRSNKNGRKGYILAQDATPEKNW